MRRYKIVYTHGNHSIDDDNSMTFSGLEMLDALAYIRHLAVALNMTDFRIMNVFAETDDGGWAEVSSWADDEYQHQLYLAEQARNTNDE